MSRWTVEDEINLVKWVESKGIRLCYMPKLQNWGFYNIGNPREINGGFESIVELKQYLVNLRGEKKNVLVISEDDFQRALEEAGGLPHLH